MENQEKTEGTLELDKLEAHPKKKHSGKASRSTKWQSKPETPGKKGPTFRILIALVSKNKVLVFASLGGLLVVAAVVLYYLLLPKVGSHGVGSGTDGMGKIVYKVASSIGDHHDVSFTLSIPFKNDQEKAELMEKLPKIRYELITAGSRSDIAQSIMQKDFEALRKHILKIVHELTGVPMGKLDLEGLALY